MLNVQPDRQRGIRHWALPVCLLSFVCDASAESSFSGDFDCDGRQDVASAAPGGDPSKLDILFGSGESVSDVQVGDAGDTAFAADADGDGCSELYAQSARGTSSMELSRSALTGKVNVMGLPCDKKLKNTDGGGGFVNNPHNSKGKLKAVLPNKYNRTLKRLKLAKNGVIKESLGFVEGNEWGNRMRFYSKGSPRSYGRNIVWVLELKNGKRECIPIPDPTKRYD